MLGIIGLGGNCKKSDRLADLLSPIHYAVAADSGLAHFDMLGITPDLLVGDMDSISDELLAQYNSKGLPICRYDTRKDWTDSQIAVEKAIEHGCDELVFIGAFGTRLDHMLSNQMMSVSLAVSGIPCILTDGITFFYTVGRQNSPFRLNLKDLSSTVDVISMVPVSAIPVYVSIEGLEYEIYGMNVAFGSTRMISNTVPLDYEKKADFASISVEEGLIFLIQTKKDEFL